MTEMAYRLAADERVNWLASTPYFVLHLVPLAAILTGVRPIDIVGCAVLYVGRMFFVTAGYHRYFSHRSFTLKRVYQFILAFLAMMGVQKGVLWWAALHRMHHLHSDTPEDIHSPRRGFWWSHVGWILCDKYKKTRFEFIQDFAKYPELVWLNRHPFLPPTVLGVACFLVGGWSFFLIGFVLSTILLFHGTYTINSLAHVMGGRRYNTPDTSRNSFVLALITLGEGWHNNHHHYRSSANQGFFWWEIDMTYYGLKILSALRIVRNLRRPPESVRLAFRSAKSRASAFAEDVVRGGQALLKKPEGQE